MMLDLVPSGDTVSPHSVMLLPWLSLFLVMINYWGQNVNSILSNK